MPATSAPPAATSPPAADRAPRASLWALRLVAVVHALLALAQPLLAGMFLDGEVDAVDVHATNALVLSGLALLLVVVAVAYGWRGRGRWWPLLAGVGFLVAEELQTGLGYARLLAAHLPLGVLIVMGAVVFAVWTCTRGARRTRGRRGQA